MILIFFTILLTSSFYHRNEIKHSTNLIISSYRYNRDESKMSTLNNIYYILNLFYIAMTCEMVARYNRYNSSIINSKKYFDIPYYMPNGERHLIRVKKKRGPCMNSYEFFNGDNNVTDDLKPFLGPYNDFHRCSYTPNLLGYDTLKIVKTSMDDEKETAEFSGSNVIVLN